MASCTGHPTDNLTGETLYGTMKVPPHRQVAGGPVTYIVKSRDQDPAYAPNGGVTAAPTIQPGNDPRSFDTASDLRREVNNRIGTPGMRHYASA